MSGRIEFPRRSGIILHPTSLPGPDGIGTLGDEAYRFVDFLVDAGQTLWQVLPLLPLGYGNSPYSSPSAFAKNSLLVSAEALVKNGLLDSDDLKERPSFHPSRVDYGTALDYKKRILGKAWERFKRDAGPAERRRFRDFRAEHAYWLDNYALYLALKERFGQRPWFQWPDEIARRESAALQAWTERVRRRFNVIKFAQFLFFEQWGRLKAYANERGIEIIGDIPFFVSHDSADVWASRGLFLVNESGNLVEQSGVPPDKRENASQIWGTPLYNWEAMLESGFEWWTTRFSTAFELTDIVRLDHFYGFARCWHVPMGAATSREGRWVKSPGLELFQAVSTKLGALTCFAEDLGYEPPPGLEALLEATGFPGVRLLHYAFDTGPENYHLPHNHIRHTVVYTGMHDHDTALGWFKGRPARRKKRILNYLGSNGDDINWDLIRIGMASVAHTAIFPLQDVLGLGSEARMNTPGASTGQWEWRFSEGTLTGKIASKLAGFASLYGRR